MTGHTPWSEIRHKRTTRSLVDVPSLSEEIFDNSMSPVESALELIKGTLKLQEAEIEELRESRLNLLKMLRDTARERDETLNSIAIDYEMYGNPERLVERAEDAENALGEEILAHEATLRILDETQAQLNSCKVSLHDQQKHELGRMCAEQTDKLDRLQKLIEENGNIAISAGLTSKMLRIIDGTD